MEYLYETHMHTSQVSACAISTAQEQAAAYEARGYTGIIVTDHFVNGNSTCPPMASWDVRMKCFMEGYECAKATGDDVGLDVFFGWEYSIKGSDFLTYGLGLDFLLAHPELESLETEEYSELIRGSGGYLAQAHPFRGAWYIERIGPVDWHLLDGVEVFNSGDPWESNSKAYEFAQQHSLPMQAGSDSHSAAHERCSGITLEHKASDIFDIIDAIKSKKAKLI